MKTFEVTKFNNDVRRVDADAALVEDGRFRRVEVFRLVIAQHPAAKGDDAAPLVADGKDHPIAEAIVDSPRFILHQHPGLFQQGFLLLVGGQLFEQVIPARRCEPEVEPLGNFPGESALLEIVNCAPRLGVLTQLQLD